MVKNLTIVSCGAFGYIFPALLLGENCAKKNLLWKAFAHSADKLNHTLKKQKTKNYPVMRYFLCWHKTCLPASHNAYASDDDTSNSRTNDSLPIHFKWMVKQL